MSGIAATVRGTSSLALYTLNTIFWCTLLFIVAGIKALVPLQGWRVWFTRRLHQVAENWIWFNNLNQSLLSRTSWRVQGLEGLDRYGSYLVLANHRSWVDILVLQRIFNRRIPFLKFFIKKELFWFPMLGQAWWVLDFPFIKRYPKHMVQKDPRLKEKNLESTRNACQRYRHTPTSIMDFAEGTRFSAAKHDRQASPFTHLLKPKAGGIASVLQTMGDCLSGILDITILYPDDSHSFWAFACGKIREVRVSVRQLAVSPDLVGDYGSDATYRERVQNWLNTLWAEKDRIIDRLRGEDAIP